MICDEAQKIKNPNAQVTRAAKKQNVRFRIACTGTPVENSLADLWCLFDFVQPGMLGALNEFGTRYRRPIEAKTQEQKARVEELRSKIDQQILRRTKAEVATELKRKIVNEPCRALPMSAYQASLYSQALATFQRRDEHQTAAFRNHLGLLHYSRQLCTAPRPAGTIASAVVPLAEYRQQSPKLDWLIRQLTEIQELDEKAIVFCEFRDVQRQLRSYIEQAFGSAPDIINGDTTTSSSSLLSRQNRLRLFQESRGFRVIILSPLAVGFGVNIQAANHVIHYTRTWNPAKEDQATDRAYRIGQTKDVHVYYPVIQATGYRSFEQVLDELLSKKREIATDMLNGAGDVLPNEFDIRVITPADGSWVAPIPIGLAEVQTLHWKHFEALAEALWRSKGFDVVYRTPDVGDGGVDVVAINGSQGVLIQCKSAAIGGAISWDAIKDVVTGHAAYKLRHPGVTFELVCMTNQRFNAGAVEQGMLNVVTLIDVETILAMLYTHPMTLYDLDVLLNTNWNNPVAA